MEIRQKDFGQIRIISVSSIQYNIVNELMRYKCMETWESSITLGATNVVWYEVEITRLPNGYELMIKYYLTWTNLLFFIMKSQVKSNSYFSFQILKLCISNDKSYIRVRMWSPNYVLEETNWAKNPTCARHVYSCYIFRLYGHLGHLKLI